MHFIVGTSGCQTMFSLFGRRDGRQIALNVEPLAAFRNGDCKMSENTRYAAMIGLGALRLWPDLPRDVQERLFEEAVRNDEELRHGLALYLHHHHPRTSHPPKPQAAMP